jgi:xanthine dehydrogenase YagS FAD-binding subunit
MRRFAYRRPDSAAAAVQAASATAAPSGAPPVQAPGQFIAGGTTMTDYMTLDVMRPAILVDINHLPKDRYAQIEASESGLRFGALVRMAQAEDHPLIQQQYPLIHETLVLAATRQIRNMASLGGNLLQRTRCEYFRETSWPCNKRNPGSGCSAIGGVNRQHAVLGTSEQCIAAYPGDFAQAMIALDATVETIGPNGPRKIAFAQLHKPPGATPNVETVLQPGELITFITVPAGPWTARSHYVKVRDRESYQFALASAAVALHLEGETVQEARIALGGVASVPWRAHAAEDALRGKRLDEDTAMRAAQAAFADARTYRDNTFKVPIGQQAVVRALLETKAMKVAS